MSSLEASNKNDRDLPISISAEDESVDSNLLVTSHTEFLNQLWLGADSSNRTQEPAVTKLALNNIAIADTIFEELGFLEDLTNATNGGGGILRTCFVDGGAVQAVVAFVFEVPAKIPEMR